MSVSNVIDFEVTDLDVLPKVNTGSSAYYLKQIKPGAWEVDTPVNVVQFNKELANAVLSYLRGVYSIQTDNKSYARKRGYMYVGKDVVFDPPPSIHSDAKIKVGTPHANFEERVRAGEILVSDYERGQVSVKRKPGLRSTSSPIRGDYGTLSSDVLEEAGIFERRFINHTYRMFFQGAMINRALPFEVCAIDRIYSKSAPVWSYGWDVNADSVIQAARGFTPDVTSLVTSVLANANKRSVDVLTAMAELPKTIKSVLRGFKSVAHIIRDVKSKQFSLSKAYEIRKKIMNSRYNARMERLQKELASKSLSGHRRKSLSAQVKRVEYTHRSALLKSADELSKALGDLWMNYRYNIMTNVYLAQDVYDAVHQYGRRFVTAAGTQRNQGSLQIGDRFVEASFSSRVMIKRRFSQSAANNGSSVIGSDIFTTAWELVPLSYVIDWFVNVGNLLSAQSYNTDWEAQGSTLAKKVTFDATLGPDGNYEWIIEPQTVVRGEYYKRTVINPHDHCGLVWKPTMGLERQIDALVLIWRPVRSLLLQNKRNK